MSLFPTCIHLYVCVSGDVISMQWSGKSDGANMYVPSKETGGHTQ